MLYFVQKLEASIFLPGIDIAWNTFSPSEKLEECMFDLVRPKDSEGFAPGVLKPRITRVLHFKLLPWIPHKALHCPAFLNCPTIDEFSRAYGKGWCCRTYCHIRLRIVKHHMSQVFDTGRYEVFIWKLNLKVNFP